MTSTCKLIMKAFLSRSYIPRWVVKFCAASLSSWLEDTSNAEKGLNTGLGKIHKNRDASPLSTLFLSTMSGAAVAGCVIPHKVRQVRSILKLAFPATIIEHSRESYDYFKTCYFAVNLKDMLLFFLVPEISNAWIIDISIE